VSRLKSIANGIDDLNRRIGGAVAWLTLAMVIMQFVVVLMRYVFGIFEVQMQESIVYMHGVLFMLAAGYTLLNDEHVRVDLIYREASPRYKALVNLLGALFFLMPVMALIAWYSWPYVELAWKIREGSRETSGIHGVYLLKSVILAFAGLVFLQGVSMVIHSFLALTGSETPPKAKVVSDI
jgi:TRAP-type mannitol/chloroaromatic compound transport system permease small subunit